MRSDVYELIWYKTLHDDRYSYTLHVDRRIIDLDLDSRSQEFKKAKPSEPSISQSFQSVCMEFGLLWRLIVVVNLILI